MTMEFEFRDVRMLVLSGGEFERDPKHKHGKRPEWIKEIEYNENPRDYWSTKRNPKGMQRWRRVLKEYRSGGYLNRDFHPVEIIAVKPDEVYLTTFDHELCVWLYKEGPYPSVDAARAAHKLLPNPQ